MLKGTSVSRPGLVAVVASVAVVGGALPAHAEIGAGAPAPAGVTASAGSPTGWSVTRVRGRSGLSLKAIGDRGVRSRFHVRGRGKHRVVTGNKVLTGLKPGRYRIRAVYVPVVAGKWAPVGKPVVRVRVRPGTRVKVVKRYRFTPNATPTPTPTPSPTPTPTPSPTIPEWNAQAVAPLGLFPGGEGSSAPVYSNAVVSPDQALSVSLSPWLLVPAAGEQQQLSFRIFPVVGKVNVPLWSTQKASNKVRVPVGVLEQGRSYVWTATDNTNKVYGPYGLNVDVRRVGVQATQPLGPVTVAAASGALTTGVGLRSVDSASGPLSLTLSYANDVPGEAGVPAGWSVASVGQVYDRIVQFDDGSAELVTSAGLHVGYVPTSGGAFAPSGRDLPLPVTGVLPTVVKNPDDTWTVTGAAGGVGLFEAGDADGVSRLTQVVSGTSAQPQMRYSAGRLSEVVDPISGRSVQVVYQDTGDCVTAAGFVSTPESMACEVRYPDGSVTRMFYQRTSAGVPVLARVVDNATAVQGQPAVWDFGWNQGGQLVAVRAPLAASVLASGVAQDSSELTTWVGYDDAGRVSQVKEPGDPVQTFTMSYSPTTGTTRVRSDLQDPTAGVVGQVVFDTNRWNVERKTTGEGLTSQVQWADGTDDPVALTSSSGLRQSITYDEAGRVSKVTGPWPAKQTANSATPQLDYGYDLDVSGATPKTMHGFNTFYWSNEALTGAPDRLDFGPTINGGVPASVQFGWDPAPVAQGPWSVRLMGLLATDEAGEYRFKTSSSAVSLWIDDVLCGATCTIALKSGSHQIRLDYTRADGGPGSLAVSWETPSDATLVPIPMTRITPGYGLVSQAGSQDALSSGDPVTMTTLSAYAKPYAGQATADWAKQLPGARSQADYETYRPADGLYGRQTWAGLPAGNGARIDYWGANETTAPPCQGMDPADQAGLVKSVTRSLPDKDSVDTSGTQTYTSYYDQMGRQVATTINDASPLCVYYNDAGQVTKTLLPARGEAAGMTTVYEYSVGNNPLIARKTTTTTDGQRLVSSTQLDRFGSPVHLVDSFGTTQDITYDPLGQPIKLTTTTAAGWASTTEIVYDRDGNQIRTLIDGRVVATNDDPITDAERTVRFGNGTDLTVATTATGALGDITFTDAHGTNLSYRPTTSAAGRILKERYDFDGAPAVFDYTYDPLGRLTAAHLDTSLDVDARDWAYEFDQSSAAGLNSNRTAMIVDGQRIEYSYDSHDQLVSSTDPTIGSDLTYSTWGELERIGDLRIDYNATSQPVKITDMTTGDTLTFVRDDTGAILTQTTTTGGIPTEQNYTLGGIALDKTLKAGTQTLGLPGGVELTRNLDTAAEQWAYSDGQGRHMWTADAAGTNIGYHGLYEPFGAHLTTTEPPTTGPQTPNLQWQQGNGLITNRIGGTELISMGDRLYSAALGRFTSPDPVLAGSFNPYDYADQDPINNDDPAGQASDSGGGWAHWLVPVAGAVTALATDGLTERALKTTRWSAAAVAESGSTGRKLAYVGGKSLLSAITAGAVVFGTNAATGGQFALKTQLIMTAASAFLSTAMSGYRVNKAGVVNQEVAPRPRMRYLLVADNNGQVLQDLGENAFGARLIGAQITGASVLEVDMDEVERRVNAFMQRRQQARARAAAQRAEALRLRQLAEFDRNASVSTAASD